ncbi:MAG: TIGR01777 family oxidoreductase [Cryomorphaceae bacterium]
MNITLAGGTGFLGRALANYFRSKGHEISILTRKPKANNEIYWTGHYSDSWAEQIQETDILINLSGKSVDCRYTSENKKLIIDSRINPTMALHKAITEKKIRPKLWLNASSATIYVHAETQQMTETEGIIGDDFSMNVCKKWEAAFFSESHPDIRQVALRTSIVLGKDGGAFQKLKPLVILAFGGKQGRGDQMVSWIHIKDFCRAVEFMIQKEELHGRINVTSPHPIPNKDFMGVIRGVMNAPFGISQPTWLLEMGAAMIGTETELLLKSRFVKPEILQNHDFKFEFPTITDCIQDLCKSR